MEVLNDTFWFAMGVAATLVSAFVAHRIGRIQISIARQSHELSLSKAIPKIVTNITVEERYDNGRNYPAFLYLTTTIYNEGELAISNLNGNWQLTSSYGVLNHTVPIQREFLGPTPYQLQPYRIAQTLNAPSNQFRFDVDIEFDYATIPPDNPQHYSAKYQYDYHTKQMHRI